MNIVFTFFTIWKLKVVQLFSIRKVFFQEVPINQLLRRQQQNKSFVPLKNNSVLHIPAFMYFSNATVLINPSRKLLPIFSFGKEEEKRMETINTFTCVPINFFKHFFITTTILPQPISNLNGKLCVDKF